MPDELIALLDELSSRGLSLRVEAGRLRVRGPEKALTPALRDRLGAHRDALLALLRDQQGGQPQADLVPVPRTGDLPLSFGQQRLWFVTQLAPASNAAYNIVAAVRLQGALQVDALARSLNELVRRHETLRTGFVSVEGRPAQRIQAEAALTLARIELSGLPPAAQDDAVARRLREENLTPFDLTAPPLLRATLLTLAPDRHVLAVVIHHLVSDGWSSGVIIRELARLYEAYSAGRPSPLPPLAVQYVDYVMWQRGWLQGDLLRGQLDFWKGYLAGVPVLQLPTDHPRPGVQSYAGASESFVLPVALSRALNDLSRREGATLFMTLLAAFAVLLSRRTGQTDLAIGSSIANRGHRHLEDLIGFFTNTLVMRVDLSGNPTFAGLVGRVRAVAREAYGRQDVPFEKLVEELQPERVLSQNPLFQVAFSLLQAHRDTLRLGDLTIEQIDVPSATSRFDLTLTMEDAREGLVGSIEYNTDLFERETIRRTIEHLDVLLHAVAADPGARVADLPVMTDAERRRVTVELNDTVTDYPRDRCVHELFEAEAARRPDAVALRAGTARLTYGELNARANRLARRLRARGVGPEVAVAICAERSIGMIVGLVAILKAGGFYVPFDPGDPPDRLGYLFEQVQARLLLAPAGRAAELARFGRDVYVPEQREDELAAEPAADLPNLAHPDNLIYTTYTSGSTGLPKGICIPHRGVVRLVRDTNYMRFEPSLVILEIAPVSFDASTFEIWGALANGAQLVIMPPEIPSLHDLGETIRTQGVTSLYLTSALFSLMVDERVEVFAGVRHLLVGGDAISVPHARKLLAANPGVTLINGYGPTETTTFAACGILTRPDQVGHSVTIGTPIANTTTCILDDRMNPVPIGVPGDLYIGGDGNARGYLNLPALTAASFVPDPFGRPGGRLYRTGDLARHLADGTMEFLGRRDSQVKLRGFRIELGEIENVLGAVPGVKEAVVLVLADRPGDKRLVAFVQPRDGVALTEEACLAALRAKLPDYMVPSAILIVEAFPLTAHNKIDRSALRTRAADRPGDARRFVEPRTAVEAVLAGIWRDVLQAERVGATDDFFALGGHSLLATQVMWRVFEAFRVELPLRQLFESPTIEHFAAALERADPVPGRLAAIAELRQQLDGMSAGDVERLLREKTAG
ncbi:MAG: amino acid adenylation domain-containing protein [Acidobacteriota bacterium]|nr:amino acid adenylation domain-containing protein [Acidobacteriota bacterium]